MSVTTTGSGNWSSKTPNAPWPGGIQPVPGDDVIIGDGHVVVLDQNANIASLTAAGSTGYCTCDADVTLTLTGGGITYSGTLTAGFIRLTGHTLNILGSGATCLIAASAAGRALVVTNAATYILNNGSGAVLNNTSSGRCISSTSTSLTCSVTGTWANSGTGLCLYHITNAGTITVAGDGTSSSGPAFLIQVGTLVYSGKPLSTGANLYQGSFSVSTSGTLILTGTVALAAGENVFIVGEQTSCVITLGTIGTPFILNNNGGSFAIACRDNSTITLTAGSSLNNRTTTAQTCILGQTVAVNGPTLPAAGDVRDGVDYGYNDELTGTLQDKSYFIPMKV